MIQPPLSAISTLIALILVSLTFGVFWLVHLCIPAITGYNELRRVRSRLANKCLSINWFFWAPKSPVTEVPLCWDKSISSPEETPVDEITWNMLSWLITYSKDTGCVDIALQSIPGARAQFPDKHSFSIVPPHLILERLGRCFWMDPRTSSLRLKKTASVNSVLQYCRALSCLATSNRLGLKHPMFSRGCIIGELRMILEFCAR